MFIHVYAKVLSVTSLIQTGSGMLPACAGRYQPKSDFLSVLANGTAGRLSFRMRNDGVAPIYIKGHRGVVKAALMDNATNVLSAVTLKGVNPFDWKPGETIVQESEITFPKNAKGTKLALGVFTSEALKNPDIKLGIDHSTGLNWYVLTDMPRGVK